MLMEGGIHFKHGALKAFLRWSKLTTPSLRLYSLQYTGGVGGIAKLSTTFADVIITVILIGVPIVDTHCCCFTIALGGETLGEVSSTLADAYDVDIMT